MRFARLSIARMMLLILLIAAGAACLFRPTRLGAALAFSATFLLLVMTTVAAIFGRRQSRPFVAGFSIGGWATLALHFSTVFTPVADQSTSIYGQSSECDLPTTALLDAIYPRIFKNAYQSSMIVDPAPRLPITVPPSSAVLFSPNSTTISSPPTAVTSPNPGPPADPDPDGANVPPADPVAPPASISSPPPPPPPPPPAPILTNFVSTPYHFWLAREPQVLPMPVRSSFFMTIGYSIFTWIFAFAIGLWTSWIASRKKEDGTAPSS